MNSADPDEMPHLCGISSGSSMFAKVPVLGFSVYKGLKGRPAMVSEISRSTVNKVLQ